MKDRIKKLLHTLGIYEITRKAVTKIYYPYKNYRIRSKAAVILDKMHKIFEDHTDDYWLDYGTLLGFVREGKIIKGDLDLDFGVVSSGSLAEYLKRENIHLKEQTIVDGVVAAEQYYYEDIGFDVFYYRILPGGERVTNVWLTLDTTKPQQKVYEEGGGELGETTFAPFDTKEILFYGVTFRVPVDSDKYLKEHFGNDYIVPNPNFTHRDEKNRVKVDKPFEVRFYE